MWPTGRLAIAIGTPVAPSGAAYTAGDGEVAGRAPPDRRRPAPSVTCARSWRVIEEQLQHLADEADDTRIRSLVSETPLADREHHDAQRHADAMAARRREVRGHHRQLEARQDALLDELTA